MSIDNLDMMIIGEMENDARQSVRVIAKKLGLSPTTVSYRLNRLINDRFLTIACIPNPEILGYQFLVMIGINVSLGKGEAVAKELEVLPEVKIVALTTGRYRVMIWALFSERLDMANFITEKLECISGIKEYEAMISYEWVKNFWQYFKPQKAIAPKSLQYDPSDLDLSIVRAMQQNPRQTLTELATAVGCSRLVVKRRLGKLFSEEVIRLACMISSLTGMTESNISLAVLIKVKPGSSHIVADEISKQDPARLVSLIISRWQIFFGATFTDKKHMESFFSETMDGIPGIEHYDVIFIDRMLKYSIAAID